MTALPTSRTSPMAGLVDAMRRYYIQLAPGHITALEAVLANEQQTNRELTQAAKTRASFRASEAAGYIDRTGLEGP